MTAPLARQLRIAGTSVPVVLPKLSDARLHVASVIVSIHVLGQTVLGFRVSVPQILSAILTCALIEVVITFVIRRALVWPASAMLTGSGVGLILRDVGTVAGDHWSVRHWWLFSAVAGGSLLTKYLIRWRGSHLFNPSNLGLVVAFLVLGSDRIEPLDFWWRPFDLPMLVAYAIIATGGLLINDRLDLLELAGSFWATLAVLLGGLSLVGHCIVTAWSLTPVCDLRFWWVVVSSPETLIFMFFMVTDPRTVPSGRWGRVAFGVSVGIVSSLLMAPQRTEFGAKVGLLGGLVLVCAARPVIEFLSTRVVVTARRSRAAVLAAPLVPLLLAVGVAAAGAPARTPDGSVETAALPDARDIVADIEQPLIPPITADEDIAIFGDDLPGSGNQLVAIELLRNLAVERLALQQGDPELLRAVDHGSRLVEMRNLIKDQVDGERGSLDYRFDSMHLTVGRLGGQSGALLGVEGRGTTTALTYNAAGDEIERDPSPFALEFILRPGDDGRWLLVWTRPLE